MLGSISYLPHFGGEEEITKPNTKPALIDQQHKQETIRGRSIIRKVPHFRPVSSLSLDYNHTSQSPTRETLRIFFQKQTLKDRTTTK